MEPISGAQWAAFRARPDEAAFAPIYDASRALVYTLCYRILGDRELALDAFQSTYARLLAELRITGAVPPPETEPIPPNRWIARLALREAWSLAKRRNRRARKEFAMDPLPPAFDPAVPADAQAARRQFRDQIETLIRVLPERERLPLQLHYLHGLLQTEIAEILEVDKSTVSRRIERGLKRLQPLVRRAGLGESLSLLAAIAAGAALLEPPAAAAAGAVFASASAAAAALGAGNVSFFASSHSFGGALMKFKMLGWGAAAIVAGIGLTAVLRTQRKPEPPVRVGIVQAASSARPADADSTDAAAVAGSQTRTLTPVTPPRIAEKPSPGGANPGEAGTVEGVVHDKATGKLIAGAKISIHPAGVGGLYIGGNSIQTPGERRGSFRRSGGAPVETVSGEDGRFRLSGAKPGVAEMLVADEPAHVPAAAQFEPKPDGSARVDFDLEPAGTVVVKIFDRQNRPIKGATAMPSQSLATGISYPGRMTDATGTAVITQVSMASPPLFTPTKPGFIPPKNQVPVFNGTTTATLTFSLDPDPGTRTASGAVYAGTVFDADGRPLADATVTYAAASLVVTVTPGQPMPDVVALRRLKPVSVQTGPDGHYRLETPQYLMNTMLWVSARGWAPVAQAAPTPAENDAAKPLNVDFKLEPGSWIAGRVVDAHGNPLADCPVSLGRRLTGGGISQTPLPPMNRSIRSDALGKFRFEDLPIGQYSASAQLEGFPGASSPWTDAGSTVEIKVLPYGAFRGRVVDSETGEPVKQFTILRGATEALLGGRRGGGGRSGMNGRGLPRSANATARVVTSAADGRFKLDKLDPNESLDLTIQSEGYADLFKQGLPIGDDASSEVVLALGKRRALTVRVTSGGVGVPVEGAKVTAGLLALRRGIAWDSAAPGYGLGDPVSLVSDANGNAELPAIDPSACLMVEAEGFARRYVGAEERAEMPRQNGVVEVALEREASVQGSIPQAEAKSSSSPDGTVPAMRVGLLLQSADSRPSQSMQTLADASGKYRLGGLPAGDYRIDFLPASPAASRTWRGILVGMTFKLKAGERKTLDLIPPAGSASFAGRIVSGGKPAVPSEITLAPNFEPSVAYISELCDDQGSFSFSGLAAGDYTVHAGSAATIAGQKPWTTAIHIEGAVRQVLDLDAPPPLAKP